MPLTFATVGLQPCSIRNMDRMDIVLPVLRLRGFWMILVAGDPYHPLYAAIGLFCKNFSQLDFLCRLRYIIMGYELKSAILNRLTPKYVLAGM